VRDRLFAGRKGRAVLRAESDTGVHPSIPVPLTDETDARFHHRDLPLRTDLELFAERNESERILSDIILSRRSHLFWTRADGVPLSDIDWLTERCRRIAAEQDRRAGARKG
jgi:hypothetical protein